MTIRILGVKPSDYSEADRVAHETAEQWLLKIRDLFITERSHQKQIGISEVGSDCRKCVARKLAEKYKKPSGGWFPFVGTAVHAQLEAGFAQWDDYKLEERLQVWEYKGLKLGGSCDMAAVTKSGDALIVNDWKVVGDLPLKDAGNGKIKEQYRIQAMLYGMGWENKGENVTHVSLTFLPRNQDLPAAEVVMLRYDKQVALDALDKLAVMIDAAELIGWDAVIEKQPKASFCYDCKRFEQEESSDIGSLI